MCGWMDGWMHIHVSNIGCSHDAHPATRHGILFYYISLSLSAHILFLQASLRMTVMHAQRQQYAIVKDSAVKAAVASCVLRGSNYTTEQTNGGSQLHIQRIFLFPNDMHVSSSASVTNVQRMTGPDVTLNLQYLQVLVGGKTATGCTLYTFPRGNDPLQATCRAT